MKENKDEVEDYRKFWNSYGAEVKVRPMLEWTTTGTVRSETIKHHSEVKVARFERDHVNFAKWHAISVRRFHRSDRQETKRNLKQYLG